jgi:hypothetical protein
MNRFVLEVFDEFRRISFSHHKRVISGSDSDDDGYDNNIGSG